MPSALTDGHRRQQLALRALTIKELRRIWPTLDVRALDATYPAWAGATSRLIRDHRGISSALAVRYLRALRAEAGVPGEPPLARLPALPAEQIATALRVTSVVAMKKAAAHGAPTATASEAAFVTSAGAATRLVMDGGRATVIGSVTQDEHANGWRRVTGGKSCGFCSMLAGRGAVYSENTAGFRSHDHCACSAEPVYSA